MTELVAQGMPEEIFPFLLGALMFMIPIVAILTTHQRKMAMILRGRDEHGRQTEASEMQQLRHEVGELRQVVSQQAITLDTICDTQRQLLATLGTPEELAGRLRNRG